MSYEIIYDRAAIKVGTDKYLTLLISGSNNCFDVLPNGRERRERNWTNNFLIDYYTGLDYGILTQEQISQNIDKAFYEVLEKAKKNDDYKNDNLSPKEYQKIADKYFSYYSSIELKGSNTTFRRVKNFIMNAVKKYAATSDEYAKAKHPLIYKFYHYEYRNDRSEYYTDKEGTLTNSNIEDILQYQPRKDKYKQLLNIRIQYVDEEEDMVRLRKIMFPDCCSKKKNIPVKDYYIELTENKSSTTYYFAGGQRRFYFSLLFSSRKCFTKPQVKAKAKALNDEWGHKYKFVVRYESPNQEESLTA